jgi:hypothetical protein
LGKSHKVPTNPVIEQGNDSFHPIIRSIFAARMPTSHIMRYGRAASSVNLRDPYTSQMKARFEDAWRADPIIRETIERKVMFILGKRTKTSLDIAEEFPAEEQRKKAVEAVMSNQEYQKAKAAIDETNRRVKFHQRLRAAIVQCKVAGRSALFIEKFEGGRPADLKVLNSFKLGQVKIDEDTWHFKSVQYSDYASKEDLMAEDLLYFTNLDYHVSPNTLHYGYSEIEGVAHVSECNRMIDEMDLKEINRSLWAGFGLIRFKTKNEAEMEAFISKFDPAIWTAINQDVDIEVRQIAHDLEKLVMERTENDKRIIRALGVPLFLMGYEDIPTRATAHEVLLGWRESVLEDQRTWLRDMLEPQWYDTLLMQELNIKDISEIKVKVKQEFEDITFETFKDKADALLPLYSEGILPLDKLLKMLDMEDIIQEVQANKEKLKQERLKQQPQPDDRPSSTE